MPFDSVEYYADYCSSLLGARLELTIPVYNHYNSKYSSILHTEYTLHRLEMTLEKISAVQPIW